AAARGIGKDPQASAARRAARRRTRRYPAAEKRLMRGLLAIVGWIDAFNRRLGQLVAWAILAAILISSGNAILRRFFGISSNASLEMQWYLFGAVVMLCASWALHEG